MKKIIICLIVIILLAGGVFYYLIYPNIAFERALEEKNYEKLVQLYDVHWEHLDAPIDKILLLLEEQCGLYFEEKITEDEIQRILGVFNQMHADIDELIQIKQENIAALRASHTALEEAKTYVQNEEYEEAIECFGEVIEEDICYADVQKQIEDCRVKLIEVIISDVELAETQKEWKQAIDLCNKGRMLSESSYDWDGKILSCIEKLLDETLSMLDAEINNGNYNAANNLIKENDKYLSGNEEYDKRKIIIANMGKQEKNRMSYEEACEVEETCVFRNEGYYSVHSAECITTKFEHDNIIFTEDSIVTQQIREGDQLICFNFTHGGIYLYEGLKCFKVTKQGYTIPNEISVSEDGIGILDFGKVDKINGEPAENFSNYMLVEEDWNIKNYWLDFEESTRLKCTYYDDGMEKEESVSVNTRYYLLGEEMCLEAVKQKEEYWTIDTSTLEPGIYVIKDGISRSDYCVIEVK